MKFGIGGVVSGAGAAFLSVVLCPLAQAQPVVLWSSASGATRTTPGVWGNGSAVRSREQTYEGAVVLKVTVRNPEEGARLDVNPPVDLKPFLGEDGMLRLRLRFRDAPIPIVQPPVGDFPGLGLPPAPAPAFNFPRGNAQLLPRPIQLTPLPPLGNPGGGFPQLPRTGAPAGNAGGVPGNAGGPGGGLPGVALPGGDFGQPPVWTGPPPQETALRRVLITLQLEQGSLAGYLDLDLDQTPPDDNGWRLFNLPVASMRATPGANGMLRRILLTSDEEDSFYLEQMALMLETKALTVSIRRPEDPPGAHLAEITVRPGPLTLVADLETGTSDPIVEWNFDADNVGTLPPPALGPPLIELQEGAAVARGPRIDARGPVARFEYPNEEQNYRVQVTVRDRVGRKAPVTASILVKTRG